MNKNNQSITWVHVITRAMGLFEIWLATEVYPKFPIKQDGFNLNTIIISKDGIIERYIDKDESDEFERIIKTGNFRNLLNDFEKYEESVLPFFDKDPFTNREEFMNIFRQLWIHEITSFFIGLYTTDKDSLNIISHLRGTKSAQHIATSVFLPKLNMQISQNLNIDIDLLKYALPDEVVSLKLDSKVLDSRRKQYVIESIEGCQKLLVDADAIKYSQEFLKNIKNDIDENVIEIKGNSAFRGKISGKVVVVSKENDLINVKDGDILVSPMTRTSYISAMKIAGAFVTDEGGVTCHAAIVARELQKPCIVGTKIASKILKNGIRVEVDADKGVVRIIK